MIINQKRDRKLLYFTTSILSLVFMSTCTSPSFAEDLTLSLSSDEGVPGQTVSLTLSLSYSPPTSVSGFQLDIEYVTEMLESPSATVGPVLIAADKEISSSQPSSGVFRMVVSGMNQNVIQDGDAATIYFHIKTDATEGITYLTLDNLAATEPNGDPLDVEGIEGSVTVVTGIPTLSEWGMIILITVILGIGVMILRKRRIV